MGLEALARFPGDAADGPEAWFAEAWDLGLGIDLEMEAARGTVGLLAHVPEDAYLAVNVSPAMALRGGLSAILRGAALDRIVLEMTEHAPVEDYDALGAALRPWREMGARLAVDDPGGGFASLRHILRLAPDIIKLDISLTRQIDADPARRALASSITSFASETAASVVAEGIETQAELATLQGLGVRYGQGYHLGRPAPLT